MEYVAGGIMVLGVIGVFLHRIIRGMGFGARVIQLVTLLLIVPTILILGLEKILTSETVAALLGALIGYVLSGIGDFDKKQSD